MKHEALGLDPLSPQPPPTGGMQGWSVWEDKVRGGWAWQAFGPRGSEHGHRGSEHAATMVANMAYERLRKPILKVV